MTSPARRAAKSQFDPLTTTSKRDCVADTTSDLMWRATGGRVAVSHAEVRSVSGAPASRGLYLSEAVKAAAHWGVTLESTKISPSLLYETVADGAPAGVIVQCPPWRIFPTSAYAGPHMIFLQDASEWPAGETCACELRTATKHREYTVEDPGSTSAGYIQRSALSVERAAQQASGNTGCWVLVAPDTEGVYRTVRTEHWAREQPSLTSKAVKKLLVGQRIYTRFTTNTAGGEVWSRLSASYAQTRYLR